MRVLWAGLGFGSSLIIARVFGASLVGTYFLAVAIVTVFVTISQLGMDLPLMRMVSVAGESNDHAAAGALVKSATTLALVPALLFTAVIWALAGFAGRIFEDPTLTPMLRLAATAIVPFTVVLLLSRAFMGMKRPITAEMVHRLGFQIGFVVLVLALATKDWWGLGLAFAVTYWLLYGLGRLAWSRSNGHVRHGRRERPSVLLKPGFPILVAATIQLAIDWSDTLFVGYYLTSVEVGVYGTALRLGLAVTLILGAATSVVGPRYATMFRSGQYQALRSLSRWVSIGIAILSLPVLILFLAFADQVMGVFGAEFRGGAGALRILAVGQFVHAATGLVGLLLAMSGFERRLMQSTAIAAVVNIVLNIALIPRYGIEGAAWSTTIALTLSNVVNLLLVKRELGFIPVGRPSQSR